MDVMDAPERDIEHEFSGSFQHPNTSPPPAAAEGKIHRGDLAAAAGASISSAHSHSDDYSHRDSAIPIAVQRKIGFDQHERPKKRNFWADFKAWVSPEGHDVAPDWMYSQDHKRDDIIAPNGGAYGVAPDEAYRH